MSDDDHPMFSHFSAYSVHSNNDIHIYYTIQHYHGNGSVIIIMDSINLFSIASSLRRPFLRSIYQFTAQISSVHCSWFFSDLQGLRAQAAESRGAINRELPHRGLTLSGGRRTVCGL